MLGVCLRRLVPGAGRDEQRVRSRREHGADAMSINSMQLTALRAAADAGRYSAKVSLAYLAG